MQTGLDSPVRNVDLQPLGGSQLGGGATGDQRHGLGGLAVAFSAGSRGLRHQGEAGAFRAQLARHQGARHGVLLFLGGTLLGSGIF